MILNEPELIIPANLVIVGVLGWLIGRSKGRPVLGTAPGAILGVIGLLVIALIPRANSTT